MVNTSWSMNSRSDEVGEKRQLIYRWIATAVFILIASYMPAALAQSTGADGLCQFAGWLKAIATVAAIIALILFVVNSFFIKSSVVGDIIMYVIIGCVIIGAAPYLVTLTGLTTNCSI